jgi:hypothetical protein
MATTNNPSRTVLLVILVLSIFAIAVVEITGVSRTALYNRYGYGKEERVEGYDGGITPEESNLRIADAAKMPKTQMSFYETHYSFGEIINGDQVQHDFRFRNTGKKPLFISKVEAGCGCTVPSFPKKPIAPNAESTITVAFNSTNRIGHQGKSVTVYTNSTTPVQNLSFDAEVRER